VVSVIAKVKFWKVAEAFMKEHEQQSNFSLKREDLKVKVPVVVFYLLPSVTYLQTFNYLYTYLNNYFNIKHQNLDAWATALNACKFPYALLPYLSMKQPIFWKNNLEVNLTSKDK